MEINKLIESKRETLEWLKSYRKNSLTVNIDKEVSDYIKYLDLMERFKDDKELCELASKRMTTLQMHSIFKVTRGKEEEK